MAAVDHDEALSWTAERWAQVDVAIVDAADETRSGNQLPGVNVVRSIRRLQGEAPTLVVVVTGHFLNDALKHLMAQEAADFFYERAELRSADQLIDVVLHPEAHLQGVPAVSDRGEMRRFGITKRTNVAALVDYVDKHGLSEAFGDDSSKRDNPRSRAWKHHCKAMAKAANIEPRNITTGIRPQGNQKYPSLRQLRAIYRWAARVRQPSGRLPPQRPDQG